MFTTPPAAIITSIGPLTLRWYGLCIALALLAGFFLFRYLLGRGGFKKIIAEDLILPMVIAGLVGARLYYVLYAWSYYHNHLAEIWQLWQGGLAIHGALIGGGLVVWRYARRHHLSFLSLIDLAVPAMALGQAIGRWGNYFNQELFGRPTTLPWGIPIDLSHRPAVFMSAEFFHPTFLYESILNLVLVGVLLWLIRRWPNRRPGNIAAIYAIGYGIIRLTMEFLRVDYSPIVGGVRWAQAVSVALIMGGWLWLNLRNIKSLLAAAKLPTGFISSIFKR